MGKQDLRTVWMAVMVATLAYTSPSWLGPGVKPPVGYDAPWIYPGLNPTVRAEMGKDKQMPEKMRTSLSLAH